MEPLTNPTDRLYPIHWNTESNFHSGPRSCVKGIVRGTRRTPHGLAVVARALIWAAEPPRTMPICPPIERCMVFQMGTGSGAEPEPEPGPAPPDQNSISGPGSSVHTSIPFTQLSQAVLHAGPCTLVPCGPVVSVQRLARKHPAAKGGCARRMPSQKIR